MANIEEIIGVFGGVKTEEVNTKASSAIYSETKIIDNEDMADDMDNYNIETPIENLSTNLPAQVGLWSKLKSSLFGGVKIELASYGQENDYNYHEPNVWNKVKGFLFQEIIIEKKK